MSKVNKANKAGVNGGKKPSFFQENTKSIVFIAAGIFVLILLYIGYQKLYLAPRSEKAANQMYKAEQYAAIDSLQSLAIEGDGSYPGFKEIAGEYSNTKSANIANAYLGGLLLRRGEYQEAIKALEQYSPTGSQVIDPLILGLLRKLSQNGNAPRIRRKAGKKTASVATKPPCQPFITVPK